MLTIEDLDYRHGSQILFQGASLRIETGWKVGLIGPNGSGKSTLFRLITGEERPEFGTITLPGGTRVGYFDQRVGEMEGRDAVQQAVLYAGRVAEVAERLGELERRLAEDHDGDPDALEALMNRYASLQAEFQTLGGYEVESRAREVLGGLGFDDERMAQDVALLSGGWKARVALAGILVQQPDLLLLDEPTNHLDLESIVWLEEFVRGYRGTVIMTCHDHEFLNRVVDRIVEIDLGKLRLFPGDYDLYLAQREMEDRQRMAAYEKQQQRIKREKQFIESFRAKARQASRVQSRVKRLEKMDRLEPPRSRRQRLKFRIPPPPRSGNDVFVAEGMAKAYGERILYLDLDWHVRRGERWAVLGVNGAGKSTLLRIVLGEVEPDAGSCRRGTGLHVGYFAQHTTELLRPEQTTLEAMVEAHPTAPEGSLRKCLACFGVYEEDLDKPTAVLSGGEKARLVLARMLYDPPNLLVLDEPTNHLDLESRQALMDALATYEGTLLFVSHDRHFLEGLAEKVLELEDGEARVWHGGYRNYVELTGRPAPGVPARAS